MSEITTGVAPIQSTGATRYEIDPAFMYQVDVQPALQAGMLHVAVHIEKDISQGGSQASYDLYRWVVDPEAELELEQQNQQIFDESTQGVTEEDAGGATGGL